MNDFHCGYVAIVGRPNVGKSTLMNHMLAQKISITSKKPQTTRHQILGIKTTPAAQMVFIDTPGIHLHAKKGLNRYLNQTAHQSMLDVDAIVWMVEALRWTEEDEHVLKLIQNVQARNVLLLVNKVDLVEDKSALLPFLAECAERYPFLEIIPVSAESGAGLEQFESKLVSILPENPPFFPEDQVTDRSMRFLAAEIIREKLTRFLGKELPYSVTVEIESYEEEEGLVRIHALIWIERDSQKAIIVGKGGSKLKQISSAARKDLEEMTGEKVYLRCWVKVKSGWADDERALRSLGYDQ